MKCKWYNHFIQQKHILITLDHNFLGQYSLVEPGGSHRVVTYIADHTGFHAKVHRTPQHHGHGHGGGHAY